MKDPRERNSLVEGGLRTRLDRFAEYYALSQNAYQSAIKAGYSEKYANAQGGKLVAKANKRMIKKAEAQIITTEERKKTMAELVGFSREELMERLHNIGVQERDLNSALKVLTPLAKDYGVDLNPTENNITIPVLTMNVNTEARNINKPQRIIEPEN